MGWEDTYRKKTPLSQDMFGRSARLHVNGVSHNIRFFEPYPFVTASSHGRSLVDVDSNSYTDYWMGHWALVLGHRHPAVEVALTSQVSRGWMYGTVNEQTIELSQMVSDAVPAAERIRYTASGTEAVMYASRLARSATGRDVIAKVDGGWHGYASDTLKTVNWPFSEPESTGVAHDDHIVSVPYNDTERAVSILEGVGDRLAGIVVEPVLGGAGCIPARTDYLRALQECARKSGALFVLDEIVTGFRFGYGVGPIRVRRSRFGSGAGITMPPRLFRETREIGKCILLLRPPAALFVLRSGGLIRSSLKTSWLATSGWLRANPTWTGRSGVPRIRMRRLRRPTFPGSACSRSPATWPTSPWKTWKGSGNPVLQSRSNISRPSATTSHGICTESWGILSG
jgi:hypothetical protein